MSRPRLRFKWHRLKRRRSDPPFLRANLVAGLAARAPLEVDLRATSDGHWVCLHDATLERETSGAGPVAERSRAELERLRQRGEDGALLAEPPLFLDELAAAVRRASAPPPGLVQLDVKEPLERLDGRLLERFESALEGLAPAFTAGGCEARLVDALAAAAPGIARGFDPLLAYEEAGLPADAAGFRALGEAALAAMPDAAIFYLEARLVLAAARAGVGLPALVGRRGALVDAWTIDADRPGLLALLEELAGLGCGQVTSNDPLALQALWEGGP
jgi:hypothetical protein